MKVFTQLQELFENGDPEVRKWFMLNSNYLPAILCSVYVLFVKIIGPRMMKDRKAFDLRWIMVIYNFFLVFCYTYLCYKFIRCLSNSNFAEVICYTNSVQIGTSMYEMTYYGWQFYLLKYIEFLDTVFFVLRKNKRQITNLNVIHHALLPMLSWVIFRTETSGVVFLPAIVNSIVHVIMYTYYGLSAMGPSMKKYLWWKRYLTVFQMVQFVFISIFLTATIIYGRCASQRSTIHIVSGVAIFFLLMFFNHYKQTYFKSSKEINKTNNHGIKGIAANDVQRNEGKKMN